MVWRSHWNKPITLSVLLCLLTEMEDLKNITADKNAVNFNTLQNQKKKKNLTKK